LRVDNDNTVVSVEEADQGTNDVSIEETEQIVDKEVEEPR
jgi:hypothetical protein